LKKDWLNEKGVGEEGGTKRWGNGKGKAGGGERERRGEGKGMEVSLKLKGEEVHGSARHTHTEGKWRSLSSGALWTL
jgi:hypothetical protein